MSEIEVKTTIAAPDLYENDFYAWTQSQSALLRQGQWHQLDLPHLIEEIKSLGKQQRQERHRLSVLIGHLLKWQFQPQMLSRNWLATIRIQRLDIADLLEDNPSLRPYIEETLARSYQKAVELAVKDTNLPHSQFPANCPYTMAEMLDDRFYPGEFSELE